MRSRLPFLLLILVPLLVACSGAEIPATVAPVQEVATAVVATVPAVLPTEPPPARAVDTAVPTPQPTPFPSPEPTVAAPADVAAEPDAAAPDPLADPQGYLATLAHTTDPALVNRTWAWQRRDVGGAAAVIVPDSENYTLFFQEDGSFTAQIDCNSGSGGYASTLPGDGRPGIFLILGSRTQQQCRGSSLEAEMIRLFGLARTYAIGEDGRQLQLFWEDGTLDTFALIASADLPDPMPGTAVGLIMNPDGAFLRSGPGSAFPVLGLADLGDSAEIVGVSADGRWYQAVAPDLGNGFVWIGADLLEVADPELVPVVRAVNATTVLDTPWQWVSTTDREGTLRVPDPENYLVRFNADGTGIIVADCNISLGTYTLEGELINIAPGPATLTHCGAESLDTDFLYQLTSASTAVLEEGSLYLEIPQDEARMRFVPQGSPPPPEDTSIEAILSVPLTLVSFGPLGAEEPPLAGTLVTATFEGSLVNGESGCNNYSGALIPREGYFTVGPLITTKKACLEPTGVMEQEQAFLAALQNTNGLQWERVRGGGGEVITKVQTYYTLLNGTAGVLNFSSAP